MTSVAVIQVSAEKAVEEEHESSRNMKKSTEKEVLMMKNDENDEHSRAAETADEKRSQVSECSTSCYSSHHVTEEPHYHDHEHKSRQEHVVHTISIMFHRIDSNNCSADVIKK